MLCLFHAPVSARAFYYFDCHRLGENKYLLRRDYTLDCGNDDLGPNAAQLRYQEYLPVAMVLLIGFAINLPLMLGGFLFYHRNDLHSPMTRAKLGWLYYRFEKGAEYWEVHEVMRKMILTGLLIYMPEHVRAPSAVIVCVFACCTLNFARPQRNHYVFWMAEASFVLTTVKYLITIFVTSLGGGNIDSEAKEYLGYVLIALDASIIVAGFMVVILIYLWVKNTQDKDAKTEIRQRKLLVSTSRIIKRPRYSLNMGHVRSALNHNRVTAVEKNSERARVAAIARLNVRQQSAKKRIVSRLKQRALKKEKTTGAISGTTAIAPLHASVNIQPTSPVSTYRPSTEVVRITSTLGKLGAKKLKVFCDKLKCKSGSGMLDRVKLDKLLYKMGVKDTDKIVLDICKCSGLVGVNGITSEAFMEWVLYKKPLL